ncbi:sensor histidine kinase [Photobacterium sp. TY1-4]|uniref:sensor histidine kinase n=1 Tax=Photobacterium sp. TY1-4 TaxID=2899122 RepID=UPI0021C07395|nr:sensor histidine kinase [Photobacterium sp. TY1-4]UXI03766.1 sensor histidine kinase [Photobacterium sp. TY1-4]
MDTMVEELSPWWKSIGMTALFCLVIAIATTLVWPGSFYDDLIVSFGYGMSAVIPARLITYGFPQLSHRFVTVSSVLTAMLLGTANAYFWLNDPDSTQFLETMKTVILLALIFTVLCFYYFYSYEKRLLMQQAIEAARLKQAEQEKALALSQLGQLQSQIEPHFLFNTLANAIALIDQDKETAKHVLVRLTDMFRGNLNKSRAQYTTLAEEIAFISAYLDIQKIRLGDRLDYDITHHNVDLQQQIPPLMIQPLVENAVDYGIESKAEGGRIALVFSEAEGVLSVEVMDNGNGFQPNAVSGGHGLGIENIRNRLQALYGEQGSLSIKEPPEGGVIATLRVPSIQQVK